jgi:serine/threonine-protein kinase RsbW
MSILIQLTEQNNLDMEKKYHQLPSTMHSMSEVEKIIEQVREEFNLSDSYYGNILVALTEAINNAIVHGNGLDATKKVNLSIIYPKPNQLEFIIKDEGKGFDYLNLPDPTAPENIEKECGRGIFLMKNLSDELVFENGGSQVKLVFNIHKN